VVIPIEELLQIEFHAPAVARRYMGADGFDGLVSASARTKAVAVVREQRIEDRRQLLQQGLLDQAIHNVGNTQLSCPAFGFGDVDGAHILRMVLTGQQPRLENRPGVFQGSCRANRLTMPLFSRVVALDPGSTARCRSAPSYVFDPTTVPAFAPWLVRTVHVAGPGPDGQVLDAAQPV